MCFPTLLLCAAADVAAAGGARTLAELSDVLLAARYDVSKLSTLELLRWDYKQAARPLRYCHPRDLLQQISHLCDYKQLTPEITKQYFDMAVENYFTKVK